MAFGHIRIESKFLNGAPHILCDRCARILHFPYSSLLRPEGNLSVLYIRDATLHTVGAC